MSEFDLNIPVHTSQNPAIQQAAKAVQYLQQRLRSVVIGQEDVIDQVITALLAGGHVLLEGVPGVGKTLLVRTLAQTFGGHFKRLQFTPDLMPSDVTGHYMFDHNKQFVLREGPVFTNLLLADEINRAPAKTQAALLEVMQEQAVTLDGKTHTLNAPFMVLATQNPIEQEGTYPLPEAQLDRFMFKIMMQYPNIQDEKRMVQAVTSSPNNDLLQNQNQNSPLLSSQQIISLQKVTQQITVDPQIIDYAVRLVNSTRQWHGLSVGAGPRASIALISSARAQALLQGNGFVTPDHIRQLWLPVLRHRVRLSTEMEMEGQSVDDVLKDIANHTDAPRL
ncbi:ATPase AAA [Vitreoscilla sp. C1]|uniref:AAA family ATPase n=1 Tax=Vitreoscilla sp. (strain C1) TaxID=96942 RepID=UPI000CDBE2F7|nr:MoxR family ATPase [Vitreoscilla sp. C1]AUZ06086.1 ATPase AAA [Vitreoscilla sp. C1]